MDGEESTGRMEPVPKAVEVPSVVSSNKPKSIPVENEPALPDEKAGSASGASSATRPLSPTGEPSGQQAGIIVEEPLPIAPEDLVAAQEALASEPDAKTSRLSRSTKVSSALSGASSSIDYKKQALDSLSSTSVSRPLSGNITGNSLNLNEVSEKGIEVRKEQIQRAKKRAVDQKRKRTSRIVRRVIIAVVIVLVLAAVGAFSIFRWGIHDDYADMQGTWQIEGTNAKVTIADGKIRLSKEVAYDYEIDPMAKTLVFDFGQLDGSGRYRFSLDRNQLSMLDGAFESTETLSEDIPWTLQAFMDFLATNDIKSPDLGDGSITLNRVIEE